MSIYIARGDDTLGPYSPGEAADLLRRGQLRADDFAARNGDPAWVALSTLIPVEPLPTTKLETGGAATEPKTRRRTGTVVFIGLAVLLGGGALLARFWPARVVPSTPAGQPRPAFVQPIKKPTPSPAGTPSATVPAIAKQPDAPPVVPPPPTAAPTAPPAVVVAATPVPEPSPPAKKDCRLSGTVSLRTPEGEPIRFPGVRVAAYALEPLLPLLADKNAAVQDALARLAPQLEAAEAERNHRVGLAKDALQAYQDASPADPLRNSLRFAAGQAKAEVTTATTDSQYLLDQREEIMDGDFYFRDLPAPTAETQTNAGGEFSLNLPTGGAYTLAVRVHETGLGDTRTHYWLVKVVLADGSETSVTLSEANVASAGASESLLRTSD